MDAILVPLDGSERAEQALPYAGVLGRLLAAPVQVLHVVTEAEQQSFAAHREQLRSIYLPYSRPEADVVPAVCRHDETYLNHRAHQLRAEGVAARVEIAVGAPAEAIVAAAERAGAGLIAMATHGRGGVGRWLIGSVTRQVILGRPCPVLAVRGPAPRRPKLAQLLVPLDGSAIAREALPAAAELARASGAAITLLAVLAPPFALAGGAIVVRKEERPGTLREGMLAELERVAAALPDLPVTTVVGEGVAGDVICNEAARRGADLIVMAPFGHGVAGGHRLGRTADTVLHSTEVPVLMAGGPGAAPAG